LRSVVPKNNAKDVHKEVFPVYGGKCLSRKAVHNWVQKFSQKLSNAADDARPGVEVARQQSSVDALVSDGTSVSVLVEIMSRIKCFS
jgi:hypothetical protein